MIITRRYAQQLIRKDKAKEETTVVDNGRRYVAITRYDIGRTDHYEIEE